MLSANKLKREASVGVRDTHFTAMYQYVPEMGYTSVLNNTNTDAAERKEGLCRHILCNGKTRLLWNAKGRLFSCEFSPLIAKTLSSESVYYKNFPFFMQRKGKRRFIEVALKCGDGIGPPLNQRKVMP